MKEQEVKSGEVEETQAKVARAIFGAFLPVHFASFSKIAKPRTRSLKIFLTEVLNKRWQHRLFLSIHLHPLELLTLLRINSM